jgi:hypothetical protein
MGVDVQGFEKIGMFVYVLSMDKGDWNPSVFDKQAFEVALEAGKVTAETWKDFTPAQYSIEELTKKAQELYGFVSKKE